MLVCAAAFLGIGAPAASAAPEAGPGWWLKTNFGSLSGLAETPRNPIAIGGNGYIYAAESNFNGGFTNGVTVFKPDEATGGEFLTHFGEFESLIDIAVAPSTNDVYADAVSFLTENVRRWTSDGNPTPTYTIDPSFEVPRGAGGGIVVDPTTQDLLVADPGGEAVRRYDASGTLVATIATPSIHPSWILAMPDGSFYVAPASGPDLTHLSGTGTVLGTIVGAGNLHGLAYDPVRSLIVVSVGDQLVTYSTAGARLAESTAQGASGLGTVVSVAGLLYEHTGTSINVYSPGIVPGVEAPDASNITSTGFHVKTEVDPGEEGGTAPDGSAVRFEYRLVGAESWTPTSDQGVNAPGTYGADLGSLEPNSEYEVRAVGFNLRITHASGVTKVTTTVSPPATDTSGATDVTETSAVLNGTINPFGLQTSYYFEYGTTTAYGSRIPVGIEAVAGSGRLARPFSRTITGLTAGTTYHFRLVATNSAGTEEGLDRTFTAIAAGGIAPRAYEQVTPAEKHGVLIVPELGMQAETDGDGISYTTKASSNSSAAFTRMASTRGTADWNSWINTDPPLTVGAGGLLTQPTLAVSEDFTHALVVSNRALTPGGIEQGANILRVDLATGEYELIAASDDPGAFNSFVGIARAGRFHAGAPDFSWIVFNSQVPLVPGAPSSATYRWSEAAGLEVVSILPNGDPTSAEYGSSNAVYKPVSAEGGRIYFTASGGSEEGVFLQEGSGPATPVSVSQIPGDPTTPQPASLLGVNKDGRYAFLVSPTRLTTDAPGHPTDLYRYDASDGSLEYLGVSIEANESRGSLGIADDGSSIYFNELGENGNKFSVWHDGSVMTILPQNVGYGFARPSSNGRYFVVEYGGALRLYDAETDELNCISCLPDGTPASASATAQNELHVSNQYAEAVNDSGEVFFTTSARLVAADVNGTSDVYSYREGSVHLISPGNAPFDALFADVSADGEDVFFTTAQKLVGRDNDEATDIYDARANGGLPGQSPPPPQECLRDDCKATPNAGPELPFGGSEALSGPGNVNPPKQKKCGKGKRAKKVKGKVRCVKKQKANKNKKGGNR